MSRSGAEHLAAQIERSQALLARLEREHDQNPRLAELQSWQRARLRETYDDLRARPRFAPACEFFLEELYGGRDMQERDQQLQRALPVMRRMLPDHLLHAVGEALRLQWISLDFDARLARLLQGPLDQPEYARAYKALGDWAGRLEQIQLIGELGDLLRRTVQIPMVRRLVRWMRRPAHAAGFGTLQEFLDNGLDAFARMGEDAEYFVDIILERERRALERMEQAQSWPFHEWIDEGPQLGPPAG